MINKKNKTVTTTINAITDVRCNKCGDSIIIGPLEDEDQVRAIPNAFGLVEATVSGGWDSPALNDCTSYTFSLCELCLLNLFSTFKLPVEIRSFVS